MRAGDRKGHTRQHAPSRIFYRSVELRRSSLSPGSYREAHECQNRGCSHAGTGTPPCGTSVLEHHKYLTLVNGTDLKDCLEFNDHRWSQFDTFGSTESNAARFGAEVTEARIGTKLSHLAHLEEALPP